MGTDLTSSTIHESSEGCAQVAEVEEVRSVPIRGSRPSGLAVLLLVLLVAGCGPSRDPRVVGSWRGMQNGAVPFIFSGDGTCTYRQECNWETDNGLLVLSYFVPEGPRNSSSHRREGRTYYASSQHLIMEAHRADGAHAGIVGKWVYDFQDYYSPVRFTLTFVANGVANEDRLSKNITTSRTLSYVETSPNSYILEDYYGPSVERQLYLVEAAALGGTVFVH
jgi:hypothetical protein